jgi:hypothetical protein
VATASGTDAYCGIAVGAFTDRPVSTIDTSTPGVALCWQCRGLQVSAPRLAPHVASVIVKAIERTRLNSVSQCSAAHQARQLHGRDVMDKLTEAGANKN